MKGAVPVTDPSWTIIAHPATGVELPVPPGWLAVRDAGAPLVLVWPREPGKERRFRPNVVATVEQPPAELAGIDAYTATSIANMQLMLTGLYVIAIDTVTVSGHEGRRVLCGHRDGVHAIATEHWWTVAAGVATTMTASCQVEDYLDLSPVFENIAAGLVTARRPRAPGDAL